MDITSLLKKNDTKTFLGFLDQPILTKSTSNCCRSDVDDDDEEDEDTYPYLTKIGGLPIWCAQPPSQFKDLKCNLCGNYLAFLLQAYCPLNSMPSYERNFYIFVCTQVQCSSQGKGWRVIKCLDPLKEEEEEQQQQQEEDKKEENTQTNNVNINKNEDDWGLGDEDEWGVSTTSTTVKEEKSIDELLKLRDIKLKEQKLQQQQPKESKLNIRISEAESEEIISGVIIQEDKSNCFQAYHLFIEEESNYVKGSSNKDKEFNNNLLKKYENLDSEFGDDSTEWSSETYEYVKDRVFNKFLKKINLAPDQILRYSYDGKPLVMSLEGQKETSSQLKCNRCNSTKIFEFQILSTIIPQIQLINNINNNITSKITTTTNNTTTNSTNQNSNNNNNNNIQENSIKTILEFSNAFIYTCPNNCFDKSKDSFNDVIYTEEDIIIEKSI